MCEDLFYNALNITTESGYKNLCEAFNEAGSWEKAWLNFAAKKKPLLDPETEWEKLRKLGVRLILYNEAEYPPQLGEIPFPPLGIYVLGTLPSDSAAVAVVGTRKATSDGKELARRFAGELSGAGLAIVSGLALGIDAAAHEGCLLANGKTVAVLACGLDNFYPRSNERLAEKILASGGAIISEYPLGAEPLPYRFLERNRIVSGLARGVLVVEAPANSGSLATARFALDQNREVFVVPGSVAHPNFTGSNQLIRKGAELVTSSGEILETLGIEQEPAGRQAGTFGKAETEEEIKILNALEKFRRPAAVDEIVELTNLNASDINMALTMLLMKNVVKETSDGYTVS